MLNTILFSDEITLWWDKEWDRPDDPAYRLTLNPGKTVLTTPYTHVTFAGLTPATAYTVTAERIEADGTATPLETLSLRTPEAKRRLDVTAAPYFAVGDGVTLNTAALQRALDDCGEGDVVYFPAGDFLSGALDVHSHTEIYLEAGATLRGTAVLAEYLPKVRSRFEGIEGDCYRSLLNIGTLDAKGPFNCHDIVIRGSGAILGGGAPLAEATLATERERLAEFMAKNADYVKTCENENTLPGRARGRLLAINNCDGVIIAGLTLGFAASWNVHFTYCRDVVTYGCRILSRGVWNGDGWDPDSSENSVLFDTEFDTHDNSIAIKSGKNPEGNLIGRPTVGVRIFHCRGGECMAVGSEMSGGVEDVFIWDCDFTAGRAGIGLKVTPKRGGYIRGVRVRSSRFVNLRARSVTFNDDGEPSGEMSRVSDVLFEKVTMTGISRHPDGKLTPTEALYIAGLEGEENHFSRFTFRDLRLPVLADCQRICIRNVKDLTLSGVSFFEDKD